MPWLTGPAAERRRIVQGFLVLGQWNAPKLFWEKKPGVQGPNTAVCCLLANPVLSPGLHVTMEAASWSLGRLHMNILYAMDIKNQPRSLSDFRLLLTSTRESHTWTGTGNVLSWGLTHPIPKFTSLQHPSGFLTISARVIIHLRTESTSNRKISILSFKRTDSLTFN